MVKFDKTANQILREIFVRALLFSKAVKDLKRIYEEQYMKKSMVVDHHLIDECVLRAMDSYLSEMTRAHNLCIEVLCSNLDNQLPIVLKQSDNLKNAIMVLEKKTERRFDDFHYSWDKHQNEFMIEMREVFDLILEGRIESYPEDQFTLEDISYKKDFSKFMMRSLRSIDAKKSNASSFDYNEEIISEEHVSQQIIDSPAELIDIKKQNNNVRFSTNLLSPTPNLAESTIVENARRISSQKDISLRSDTHIKQTQLNIPNSNRRISITVGPQRRGFIDIERDRELTSTTKISTFTTLMRFAKIAKEKAKTRVAKNMSLTQKVFSMRSLIVVNNPS